MAAKFRNRCRGSERAAPDAPRPRENFAVTGDVGILRVVDDAPPGDAAPGDYEWEIRRLDVATRSER